MRRAFIHVLAFRSNMLRRPAGTRRAAAFASQKLTRLKQPEQPRRARSHAAAHPHVLRKVRGAGIRKTSWMKCATFIKERLGLTRRYRATVASGRTRSAEFECRYEGR
jgi:hypothetical protein